MTGVADRVLRSRVHRRVPRAAAVVRMVVGALFVWFGAPKFTDHAGWVSGFASWSLPAPSLLVYATGTVEVLGGIALVLALGGTAGVRAVGGLLALVMVGAVSVAGLLGGNPGARTLAPAMLLGSLVVVWSTTGPRGQPRRRSSS